LEYNGKFYIRKIHGKYILQRCPNRKNHTPTLKEKANQQRFIQQWRKSKSFFLVLSNDTESSNKPSNND
jgi:hypothetical protein